MARRGENIYLRKDGRYEGRYPIGFTEAGKTKFGYVYGRQYAEVKRKLNQLKAARKTATGPRKGCGKQLFSQWADLYFAKIRPNVCESSYQGYVRMRDKHILPHFGHFRMRQICTETVAAFLSYLRGVGLAPSTIQNIMRLLNACLRHAVENGVMTAYSFKPDKLAKTKSHQRVLTREEQARLESVGEVLPIMIGLYTGMRLGEVCGLQWRDVDLLAGTIHVQRAVQRMKVSGTNRRTALVVGSVKSEASNRVLYLTHGLHKALTLLRKQLATQGIFSEDGFVVGGKMTPVDPRTLQERLKSLTTRWHIHGCHFHTLRHTFATRCLELGTDIETVSEMLGHANLKITMEYYAHSLCTTKRNAIDRLGGMWLKTA